jgi:GGDEF domain-containing protein
MREALAHLFRLSIGKKLFLGFFCYGVLTVLIAFFVLSSLGQLSDISTSITQRDIPLQEIADKMVETLLAQDLFTGRSTILKSPDILPSLWKRSGEFKQLVDQMRALPRPEGIQLEKLASLYEEYTGLFAKELGRQGNPSSPGNGFEQMKGKHEEILGLVRKISWTARQDQIKKTRMIFEVANRAFRVTAGLGIAGILMGFLVALIMARNISGPISQLKLSTKEISEGRFDHLPEVRSRDELGDLSKSFQEMALRLKQVEAMYLDANPLTRLPGGVAIEQVLKTKLAEEGPLAFCLLDLRNFKAFNDRYGYARGNEVILAASEIIQQAVQKNGREGDFIGHIGGDDFVVVTYPSEYEKICDAIV